MYVPAQFNTSAIDISGAYSVYRKDVTYSAVRRITCLVSHKGQNVIQYNHCTTASSTSASNGCTDIASLACAPATWHYIGNHSLTYLYLLAFHFS